MALDLPNPPAITTKSGNVNDLQDCLEETQPVDDASLDARRDTSLRNNKVVQRIHLITVLLAWATGMLLNRMKEMVGHASWRNSCRQHLGVRTRYFQGIKGIGSNLGVDFACIRDCILTEQQRASLKREKEIHGRKHDAGVHAVKKFQGEEDSFW